jgi:hypothetical protein
VILLSITDEWGKRGWWAIQDGRGNLAARIPN